MLKLIKKYLIKIIEDIDAGNSNITEEESLKILQYVKELSDRKERMSKYQACQYLNISRATFDNYVRDCKIPKGIKQPGYKELSWYKKDLDNFNKNNIK